MTLSLNIAVDHPDQLVNAILKLAGSMGAKPVAAGSPQSSAGFEETPAADVRPNVAAAGDEAKPRRGRKAPAADVVIDQAQTATTAAESGKPEAANDEGITIEQARESMKKFAADGHMDCVEKALNDFGVKKVSDVDPDAKGGPSAKYAAFVAKINEFVGAKPAV